MVSYLTLRCSVELRERGKVKIFHLDRRLILGSHLRKCAKWVKWITSKKIIKAKGLSQILLSTWTDLSKSCAPVCQKLQHLENWRLIFWDISEQSGICWGFFSLVTCIREAGSTVMMPRIVNNENWRSRESIGGYYTTH